MQTVEEMVAEILIGVRDKIRNPDEWCVGAWARDIDGRPLTTFDHAQAVQLSVPAAIQVVIGESVLQYPYDSQVYYDVVQHLRRTLGLHGSVMRWNDTNEHPVILSDLARAVREAS